MSTVTVKTAVERYDFEDYGTLEEGGRYVKFEDYAALAAQRDALAAENAGLKDINAWCKTDAFKNMYREFKTAEAIGCHDVDCMHDAMLTAIMHAPKTPATDAFLAEVRAQESKRVYESILDNPAVTDMGSLVDWLEQNANDSIAFAAQLRKEADQ